MKILQNWLQASKTNNRCLLIKKNSVEQKNPIKFENNNIQYKHSIKFLGLHIDENLTWKEHINNMLQSLSPLVGILYEILHSFKIFEKHLLCIIPLKNSISGFDMGICK